MVAINSAVATVAVAAAHILQDFLMHGQQVYF